MLKPMATQPNQYGPPMVASGSRAVVVVSAGPHPTPPRAFVQLPDLLGEKQGEALGSLQEVGLSAQVFNDYSDSVKRGDVIGQLPAPGASTPAGTEAVLLVSSGPPPAPTTLVALPEVVGMTEQEAVSALQQAGLSPQVVREYSPSAAEGTVIAQLPSRQSLAAVPAKSNMWMVWAAIAAAVLILAALAFFFLQGTSDTVIVPDVTGLPQAEAVAAIEEAGLEAKVTEAEDPGDAEAGTVVEQDPPAGTEVPEGSEEEIKVAPGAQLIEVPDVRRMNQADATKALQDAGLGVAVTRAANSTIDKGLVAEQSPSAGQEVPEGTTVGIVISEGPAVENVDVPDVVGMTRADATNELTDAGLKVVVAENASADVAKDVVITQLPAGGDSVAPGTSIGIVVSTGPAPTPDQVDVPDVIGLTLAEAQQVISDAELEAIPVPSTDSGKPANEVVAQTPPGGTQTQKGSSVVLFYSSGP